MSDFGFISGKGFHACRLRCVSWALLAVLSFSVAGETQASSAPKGLTRRLRAWVDAFAAVDDEIYTNAVSNAEAFDFLRGNIPLFECPDEAVERTYYFRWWTYRKHLRKTRGGDGWVVTEFLPDVGWAGPENTISCAFGHHVREGRWLRSSGYLDGYIDFMLRKGIISGRRAYVSWPAWASLERAKVTGDVAFLRHRLADFIGNYEAWSNGWRATSLSLKEVENVQGAHGRDLAVGFRPEWGLFVSVGDREGSEYALSADGARPLVNSALWAETRAIAEIARDAVRVSVAYRFAQMADALERNVKARLWNGEKSFFVTLSDRGGLDDVCELHGYAPFYFGMDLRGYEKAWRLLTRETGFAAPVGLTFPARETPGFDVSVDLRRHECLWNGPSWPYATSIALTALYESLQSGYELPVKASDFARVVRQYAAQQVLKRPDGRIVPWIDENLDPFSGEWVARQHQIDWNRRGLRKMLFRERGKDYNHSTFCDLVIAGICGLVPQKDGSLVVRPLAPDAWDWWRVEGVRYHGHDVTILYDRFGTRYGKGKGLQVLRDGKAARFTYGKIK